MRYDVNKDNYVRILWNRPALIKKIVSLDEDTAAFFVLAARKCYGYLPNKLQASVKVVQAYIHETPEWKNSSYSSKGVTLSLIPQHALEQLPAKDRKNLIRRSYSGKIIDSFIEPSYEEWLEAVKNGYSIYDVPEKYYNRKTLYIAMAHHYKDESCFSDFTIPDMFWENGSEVASKSLIEVIQVCPQMILCIPPHRITNAHLITAFQTKDECVSLEEDKWLKIPLPSWNHATVQMALVSEQSNIRIVPEKYLTEDDAIKCAKGYNVSEENIPASLLTRKVLVSLAANRNCEFSPNSDYSIYGTLLRELDFQLDVLREGGFSAAKILNEYFNSHFYPEIIEVCPEYIQLIPKLEQTDKIIDAFLGAPAEIIDKMAKHINLGKIRGHHAPLLIGCEDSIIVSTIEKKLKGTQRSKSTKTRKTPHSVEIDLAPAEFASFREQLEK
jgi:hypothetical protein